MDLMARGDSATAILENLHMSSRDEGMELVASGGILEPGGDREHMWLSNLIVKADARRVSEHMRYLTPGSKSNLERLALLGRSDLRATASVTGRREVKILFDARTEVKNRRGGISTGHQIHIQSYIQITQRRQKCGNVR